MISLLFSWSPNLQLVSFIFWCREQNFLLIRYFVMHFLSTRVEKELYIRMLCMYYCNFDEFWWKFIGESFLWNARSWKFEFQGEEKPCVYCHFVFPLQAMNTLLKCKPVADLYDGLLNTLVCDDIVQNAVSHSSVETQILGSGF